MKVIAFERDADGAINIIAESDLGHLYSLTGCKAETGDFDFENNKVTFTFEDSIPLMGRDVQAIQAAFQEGKSTLEIG